MDVRNGSKTHLAAMGRNSKIGNSTKLFMPLYSLMRWVPMFSRHFANYGAQLVIPPVLRAARCLSPCGISGTYEDSLLMGSTMKRWFHMLKGSLLLERIVMTSLDLALSSFLHFKDFFKTSTVLFNVVFPNGRVFSLKVHCATRSLPYVTTWDVPGLPCLLIVHMANSLLVLHERKKRRNPSTLLKFL